MSEKPRTAIVQPSFSEAALQPRDTAPGARWEIPEGDTRSSTFSFAAQAGQTPSGGFFDGYEARNGLLLPNLETHVEMNMTGNQSTADRECYDAIQTSLESSSMMLMDILSEIRQVQLRLTALEQAISNLWCPQQTAYWEYTPDYAEFLAPNFINMQAQNYHDPTCSSQSDVHLNDDAKTQK